MTKTVRARIVEHRAPLFEEFGLTYATKLFGEVAIASLPRYQRGSKVGKIKAWLVWEKAESGGWSKYGVVRPGLVWAKIVANPLNTMPLVGEWCGMTTALSGHRNTLTVEWRERTIADRKTMIADLAKFQALAASIG